MTEQQGPVNCLLITPEELAQLRRDAADAEKLREALRNLAKAVCHEACSHEAAIDENGLPACNSPCKELQEAFDLLRSKEAKPDA